jgi:hypothetical protein
MTGPARHQQKPRGSDAVGAEDNDLGALPSFAPVGVDVDKPGGEPAASVSISLTRGSVTSRAPAFCASGQCDLSVVDLAPSGQPVRQVPRQTHGLRSPNFSGGLPGKGISRAEKKSAKTASKVKGRHCRDQAQANNSANSAPIADDQEISVDLGMGGGPGGLEPERVAVPEKPSIYRQFRDYHTLLFTFVHAVSSVNHRGPSFSHRSEIVEIPIWESARGHGPISTDFIPSWDFAIVARRSWWQLERASYAHSQTAHAGFWACAPSKHGEVVDLAATCIFSFAASTSRSGGVPNIRLYSRVNCGTLS